jgi:phage terminase large subunit
LKVLFQKIKIKIEKNKNKSNFNISENNMISEEAATGQGTQVLFSGHSEPAPTKCTMKDEW